MASITFDTLKFVEKLRSAGVPDAQAKAEAEALLSAFSEAMESQLATWADTNRIERELLVIKWITGATFAAVMAILVRLFTGIPH